MTTDQVIQEITNDIIFIYRKFKELAPHNSKYISNHRGKLVDYIFVNGKRVRTNTNNLFNNVFLRESPLGDGNGLSYRIFVNGGNVPYYNNVVNRPMIIYARHYGRSEYGNVRYSNSKEITKNNRNYKYYKDGNQYVMNLMTKYNGKSYKVTDSIGGYKK